MAAICGDRLMAALETVSVADTTLLVPATPLQANEYEVVELIAPVPCVPLAGNVPLQPPEAVHEVALLEFHVSVDVPPGAITEGLTLNVAVGVVGDITVTVTVASELVPPGPVQVIEYEVAVLRAPVLWVPLVARVPLQPPEAVHVVALVELHVKAEVPPAATAVGFAVRATVGRGFTVIATVAAALVPPGPVHVKEKVALADNAPVLCVPLTPSVPLHPPEALHEVAFAELHVSIADSPALIVVFDGVNDAVGGDEGEGESEPPPHAESSNAVANIESIGIDRTASPIERVHAIVRH
jgi:hypothetical protein